MTKYAFLHQSGKTEYVTDEELSEYKNKSGYWLVGPVEEEEEKEAEELSSGKSKQEVAAEAFRDHAQRNNSPVFEELADDIESNSSSTSQETDNSELKSEDFDSWDEMKDEMRQRHEAKLGERGLEQELDTLRKGARERKGKGNASTALAEYLEQKADKALEDGSSGPDPRDRLEGKDVDTSEMAEAASEAFERYARSGDSRHSEVWEDLSEEYEELAQETPSVVREEQNPRGVEDTHLAEFEDGTRQVTTSNPEVKEELQILSEDYDGVRIESQDGEVMIGEVDDMSVFDR
ncbi:hypothetical protein [Halobellus sp. H-GB7]|uniref:hypothetical protein n=1 Tax=Halobellus sp. H-GB7 TaxID=3069756 RepID=UPI0027B36E35|nr:hypothetical protein [Halobellus sp. H-GB7]MDQ2055997.1 hypothetical protein [Halobellus sp. H-GB7]